jgi:hypothetical protein
MNYWALKKRIHISWLIAILCASLVTGVFWAQYVKNQYISSIPLLIIAVLLAAVSLWRRYTYLVPLLIIGGALIGLFRGSISQLEASLFEPIYGSVVSISGLVKDDIDNGQSGQVVVRLGDLTVDDKKMAGVIWITTANVNAKRGDGLNLHGLLCIGLKLTRSRIRSLAM